GILTKFRQKEVEDLRRWVRRHRLFLSFCRSIVYIEDTEWQVGLSSCDVYITESPPSSPQGNRKGPPHSTALPFPLLYYGFAAPRSSCAGARAAWPRNNLMCGVEQALGACSTPHIKLGERRRREQALVMGIGQTHGV